jgi:hypothetical protein
MTAHDTTVQALGSPVLFLADADPQARAMTRVSAGPPLRP